MSEQLVYYDGTNIHLHDIPSKSNVKTIPVDFMPEEYSLTDDETSTIFCYHDQQLIIITDYMKRNEFCWSRKYVLFKMDNNLKLLEQTIIEDPIRPKKILEEKVCPLHFDVESFINKFYKTEEKLPYNISIGPEINDLYKNLMIKTTANNICYDYFENTIVLIFLKRSTEEYRCIEIWKKHENEWVLDRFCERNHFLKIFDFAVNKITRLECTKQYIIIVIKNVYAKMYSNIGKKIIIMDKYTFEIVNVIDGFHATYFDNMVLRREIFKMLESVSELRKMSFDLLNVILSYL